MSSITCCWRNARRPVAPKHKVRDAGKLASAAAAATKSPHITMPGEPTAADLIGRLAPTILGQTQGVR